VKDSLSPTQRLVLFKLLFTGKTPLQSEIKPKLMPKQRTELESLGLIRLESRARGRGKQVSLTDKAWEWASENLESDLIVPKHATPALEALEAVLGRLSSFLRERSLTLPDFFHASTQAEQRSALSQPSVEDQIREAYLTLSAGRFSQMVRLADLKQALPEIAPQAIDQALLAMQKKGDVSLQTIESMRQTTEADRRAAIRIQGQDRNLVYLEK
jgi:hypothetical protein